MSGSSSFDPFGGMGHPSSTTRDHGAPYPSSVPVSPEHDRVAVHTAVTDAQRTCCPLMSSEEMYVKHSSACVRDSNTCVWQQHLFAIPSTGVPDSILDLQEPAHRISPVNPLANSKERPRGPRRGIPFRTFSNRT